MNQKNNNQKIFENKQDVNIKLTSFFNVSFLFYDKQVS